MSKQIGPEGIPLIVPNLKEEVKKRFNLIMALLLCCSVLYENVSE
jgi:hypothetical protein